MMKHNKRARRFGAVALLLTLTLVWGVTALLPVHGEGEIYDAVVRLHVVANSDSERDQAIKLRVRDAVLTLASERLDGCTSRAEAERRLRGMTDELTEVARAELAKQGEQTDVRVELGREEYPTRSYERFCFPAGEYVSLRVLIGEAAGENFWCVLFPPLCMSAATVSRERAEEEFIAVGLSRDQYAIITETQNTRYRLRFKFLEVVERFLR
ncbi:MAG: stage II sporulation protein R [Clostridia bacterium]|nr:stage II sporulation protein R [Clostridia bacterium]